MYLSRRGGGIGRRKGIEIWNRDYRLEEFIISMIKSKKGKQ
jgi:hypothetical protein